ncbi:MAG TPA: hypothetical protein DDW65_24650 [Firmicutes bacterium]|jgi:hypothetical protein|nr:hypothetical protein [Bacillota bacterium]
MNGNPLYPPPQMNSNRLPLVRQVRFDKNQSRLEYMAKNAYIYGYPLVLMNTTKKAAAGTQLNQFIHERTFPTPAYKTIVRANVDTLYSFACLDLNKEPVVLSVPDTHQRYYLMELLDAWTNVFASLGARTTGTRAGAYAICGPNWNGKLPEDLVRIDSPNYTVFIGGRTQTNGSTDFAAVHAIQNQYALIPLSNWGNPDIQNQNPDEKEKSNGNPVAQVTNMSAVVFFQTMVKAMAINPPWIADPKMNRTLAVLGLSPDSRFDFQRLSPPV